MKTRSILILTVILVFGVLVTMVLVSQSTSDTKTDSSKAAEGATGLGAKRTKPARDTQSKPPTVDVKKRDSQPAAGEKFDPSEIREIRQAFSELQALRIGGGSYEEIQDKIAALEAAADNGAKKDRKGVSELLEELELAAEKKDESSENREIRQALSELLALEKGVGSNQQIQEKKAAIKAAVESGMKKDPKGVLSLLFGHTFEGGGGVFPGIEGKVFINSDPVFAIALLDQLPEEDHKFYVSGIGYAWAKSDPKAVLAWASQQTDPEIKNFILSGAKLTMGLSDLKGALAYLQSLPPSDFQESMISEAFKINVEPGDQGSLAMMQSLPEGRTKDLAASGISQSMARSDPQAAMDMATGIGDSNLRTGAQKDVVEQWSKKDPAAATQWINRSSLPQEVKTQLLPR